METTTLMMTKVSKAAAKAAEKEAKLYARAEKAAAKLLATAAKAEAKEAAKVAKEAAKAAAKEAKEVARPTPYDGLHIVNGILYMVDEKTNNVFAYDVATETVGDRVGLWVDGIIEYAEPPGTVVATVLAPVPGPKPAPVAQEPIIAEDAIIPYAIKMEQPQTIQFPGLVAAFARIRSQLLAQIAALPTSPDPAAALVPILREMAAMEAMSTFGLKLSEPEDPQPTAAAAAAAADTRK